MKCHYKFIDDLIPLILDADDHWWPSHLAALAMVSHAWLYYVRKRLYACPDVRTIGAVHNLAGTLETNDYLASLVKGISLQPFLRHRIMPMGRVLAKSIRVLLGLEGLKKITLGGEMCDMYIRLIGYPEVVEELHINGHRELFWQRTVTWDEVVAFGFLNLKKLRLSGIDLEMMWSTVGYPASFTELILEDVQIIGGRLVEVLNGVKRLKCLHYSSSEGMNEEDGLKEVLTSCAVECLHYQVRKTSGLWNPFSDLAEECGRSVRCLHLDGHSIDVGMLDPLRTVFSNLEELVVSGRLVSVLAKEWAEFVSSGALPLLRRLGLPWGTNARPFAKWNRAEMKEIRSACMKRGISLIERGKVI